jgi:hypothetical protein
MFMRSRKTKLGAGVSVAVAVLTLVCGVSAVTVILFGVIAGAGWFALRHGGDMNLFVKLAYAFLRSAC